jgi:cytoskeletal protein CcmA (bactofilin family)
MSADNKIKQPVIFAKTTSFNGVLRFSEAVCMRGKFTGTIDASGELTVDKGAEVKADKINIDSLTVFGKVHADIFAKNKVDIMTGAEVVGNISARKLRIADGVLFDGRCSMIDADKEIDIFTHSQDEIKQYLIRQNVLQDAAT